MQPCVKLQGLNIREKVGEKVVPKTRIVLLVERVTFDEVLLREVKDSMLTAQPVGFASLPPPKE